MSSLTAKIEMFCPVRVGQKYSHYKQKTEYLVLAVAIHTESEETMIVYRDTSSMHNPVWVRPLSSFTSLVMQDGKAIPRFTIQK